MRTTTLCKAEQSALDIISTLPQTILETILCLLSTKEAARTSILSREWRYKWTKIPKLEFNLSDVSKEITEENQVEGEEIDMACNPFYDLRQIMLLHQGPIHEFTLCMDLEHDSFGLDQIILYLSKNHVVKKLTLSGVDETYGELVNLPISVFSLHHLTDLDLSSFEIEPQTILNGFRSLRSLYFSDIWISFESLVHLLSNCPSLESLTLIRLYSVSKELPPLLSHLKYFYFDETCSSYNNGLAFILELIRCSPNLEKIKIKFYWPHYEGYRVVWEEYSNVWLEHLNEFEIGNLGNLKVEMEFVKFILDRSPNLKKVQLSITSIVDHDSFGLDQIILYLSKNHVVKKLTLTGVHTYGGLVKLPISVFSLHHLTDLDLSFFYIEPQAILNGFGSLRSLDLCGVGISFESLVHLLSNCPSLESLTLIKCSPNLEKIKIELYWLHYEGYSVVWEEYSVVWLEHLNELEITYFCNSKAQIEFVKFILARSPNLKKVKVSILRSVDQNQELAFIKALSEAPCSAQVTIMYKRLGDRCFKEL